MVGDFGLDAGFEDFVCFGDFDFDVLEMGRKLVSISVL